MQILSYIINSLGLTSFILASLIKGKKMKQILFLVFMGNLLVAISYIVNGNGINGAISSFVAAAQSIISYIFDSKNKPLPKWLVAIYALSFVILNIAIGDITILAVFAIVACLCFVMSINQKSGSKYRFWTLSNTVAWMSYDIISGAYSGLITHITMFFITLIGIIIHDRKNKVSKE